MCDMPQVCEHNGYHYICSDDTCSSLDADLTYCVSVFASDGTAEAEFMLFDKVAAGAIGKPLFAILRHRYPGYATVDERANYARHDTFVPAEVTRLVGQKFKLMVSISKKWRVTNAEKLSFQVNRIEETYNPELPPPFFVADSGSAGPSSSGSGSRPQLPALGPSLSPTSQTSNTRTLDATKVGRSHAWCKALSVSDSYQGQGKGYFRAWSFRCRSSSQALVDDATPAIEDQGDENLTMKDKGALEDKDDAPKSKRSKKKKD